MFPPYDVKECLHEIYNVHTSSTGYDIGNGVMGSQNSVIINDFIQLGVMRLHELKWPFKY